MSQPPRPDKPAKTSGATKFTGTDRYVATEDLSTAVNAAVTLGRLPPGFDEHFAGLWRYYLMYCEGGFRGRSIDVAQVTLMKG